MKTRIFDASDQHAELNGQGIAGHADKNGSVMITRPRHFWPRLPHVTIGGLLLLFASVMLAGLAVTQGYVSWHQQFVFILQAKHQNLASALEAIGLDAGAVIFAVLGVALARLGRPARIERILLVSCALGSMLMNLLGADLGSPRSVAVYVLPPVLFAAGADRLISVVRRWAMGPRADDESQRSAWRAAGRVFLYCLRFTLAPPSTALGMRRWVIQATPLPELPAATARALPSAKAPRAPSAPAATAAVSKKATLLALAGEQHDLSTIDQAKVAGIAGELAADAGYKSAGTARRDLLGHVRALQNGDSA